MDWVGYWPWAVLGAPSGYQLSEVMVLAREGRWGADELECIPFDRDDDEALRACAKELSFGFALAANGSASGILGVGFWEGRLGLVSLVLGF